MARPAIRVIDGHLCPAHGPDTLSPDGAPNVKVNSQEAAYVGNKFLCKGIMNRIATGASTVTINGEFAARALDGSDHKGKLVFGSTNVVIGGPTGMGCIGAGKKTCQAMASGRSSGKTNQSYGNCMPESLRQIIRQAKGADVSEDELLNYGLAGGFSRNEPGSHRHGGTAPQKGAELLQHFGIQAQANGAPSIGDIKTAIAERRGVVATFMTAGYWPNGQDSLHAAMITGVELDDQGNVVAVFLNDTGLGQCGLRVPAEKFVPGLNRCPHHPLVTTKGPIW